MAWGLGPRERIRTSQWPGDWTLERIRTSLDLDSVERIRISQWLIPTCVTSNHHLIYSLNLD